MKQKAEYLKLRSSYVQYLRWKQKKKKKWKTIKIVSKSCWALLNKYLDSENFWRQCKEQWHGKPIVKIPRVEVDINIKLQEVHRIRNTLNRKDPVCKNITQSNSQIYSEENVNICKRKCHVYFDRNRIRIRLDFLTETLQSGNEII